MESPTLPLISARSGFISSLRVMQSEGEADSLNQSPKPVAGHIPNRAVRLGMGIPTGQTDIFEHVVIQLVQRVTLPPSAKHRRHPSDRTMSADGRQTVAREARIHLIYPFHLVNNPSVFILMCDIWLDMRHFESECS